MDAHLEFQSHPDGYRLLARQRVERPLDEVFAFFARPENLDALTPPFLRFQTRTPSPIPMGVDARIDHQIRLFGVPMNWRTRILEYDPPRQFVDFQERGPYALWHHTHRFAALGARSTQLEDCVHYRLPMGPLGKLAHALWVKATLTKIFRYRQAILATRFAAQEASSSLVQQRAGTA